MKWIKIVEQKNLRQKRKTKIFCVFTNYKATTECIGEVRWFARWRKYCFFPASDTIYEWVCLRDIAEFMENETKNYKKYGYEVKND